MLLHRKQLLMAHALIISQLYSNPAFGDDTEVVYAAQESAPAERSALTGDWGGTRTSLADSGLRIAPRLTLFSQGKTSGNDPSEQKFSGKADILMNADLGKMQVMDGLALTIHAEYNFGQSTNNITNSLMPTNAAVAFPGIEKSDAFDFSSVFLSQRINDKTSVILGKINMIEMAAGRPYTGGAGIDTFQNMAFVAPPSGMLPPYIFGTIVRHRTPKANYTFMVYDPVSAVNRSGLENPFQDGVTFRTSVDIPIKSGVQSFSATYSTQNGRDLETIGDVLLLPGPGETNTVRQTKNRYHFSYSFVQDIYQSASNSKEKFGLFGQVGVSDGNPNVLDWNAIVGFGGTGLIKGRSTDRWGVGFYRQSISRHLKTALANVMPIRDEKGVEAFYNATITPWLRIGANVQYIKPSLATEKSSVLLGVRTSIRF